VGALLITNSGAHENGAMSGGWTGKLSQYSNVISAGGVIIAIIISIFSYLQSNEANEIASKANELYNKTLAKAEDSNVIANKSLAESEEANRRANRTWDVFVELNKPYLEAYPMISQSPTFVHFDDPVFFLPDRRLNFRPIWTEEYGNIMEKFYNETKSGKHNEKLRYLWLEIRNVGSGDARNLKISALNYSFNSNKSLSLQEDLNFTLRLPAKYSLVIFLETFETTDSEGNYLKPRSYLVNSRFRVLQLEVSYEDVFGNLETYIPSWLPFNPYILEGTPFKIKIETSGEPIITD
jgi:hypothetical protein